MRPLRSTSTESLSTSLRAWGRARDGGVAVTVAVMSAVLVGVLAIAIDLGRAYNLSTELNNAADAYALAGATQLDQTTGSGACIRAIQAAVDANLKNQETFASNNSGANVYIDPTSDSFNNKNIRFMERIRKDANGRIVGDYIDELYTTEAECDANARHIEVTIDRASLGDPTDQYRVDYSFAGVIGAATQTFPKGYAIAQSAKATCGIVPMMICPVNPPGAGPPGDARTWYDTHIATYEYNGYGLWLKAGTQNVQWGDGNFGWLRVDTKGNKELCDAIGSVNSDLCVGEGNVETEPGSKSGARQCFNTRFDIWEGSVVAAHMNDRNWQPAPNQVKGKVRRNQARCDIDPSGSGGQGYSNPDTPYNGPGTIPGPQKAMPMPRDNCAYGIGGACKSVDNFGRLGNGVWDEATYMSQMHSAAINPPTGAGGDPWDVDWDGAGSLHPDGRISRYEMYLWELGRAIDSTDYACTNGDCTFFNTPSSNLVDETQPPDGMGTFPQKGEWGRLQCFKGPMGNDSDVELKSDRRVVSALVVDCDGVAADQGGLHGNTTIKPEFIIGKIALFLVEPWIVKGGEHEIYAEIIGPEPGPPEITTKEDRIVWLNE